jgi:hypothetical protein
MRTCRETILERLLHFFRLPWGGGWGRGYKYNEVKIAATKYKKLKAALQRYNTENSKQIFPGKELRVYSPNSYIHVSVSDLYTYFYYQSAYSAAEK